MRRALKLPAVLLALVATGLGVHGCRASLEGQTAANVASDPSYGGMPQIMAATKMEAIRKAMPTVAYPALQALITAPDTMWYDKDSMKACYQDSVGNGSYTPIGARFNNEGKDLIVPEGKAMFSDDGETWSFPFGHTAGMDDAENAVIVNFLSLPIGADGKPVPVVYSTVDNNVALSGMGLHRWTWVYPKGTTFGELIFVKDSAGSLFPSELRTRTRFIDGWATNSYRPFPTAASLAAAIKAARPNWSTTPNLKTFVDHLENNETLTPKSMRSPGFNNVVSLQGAIDTLPDLGDEALIKDLLTKTTFVSVYGEAWKVGTKGKTFAASSAGGLSIAPRGNTIGLIEVTDDSCNRCHDNAGRLLSDYVDAVSLYGDLWGEDRIFSFHPYDTSRVGGAGQENRAVRKEFSSIVQRYDQSKHPSALYKALPRVGN